MGGDDQDGGPEVTTKVPSFRDELKAADPWHQVTPLPETPEEIPVDTQYEVQASVVPEDQVSLDQEFTEAVATWQEVEEELPVFEGDGPFAAPVDAPPPKPPLAQDLMSEAFAPPRPGQAGRPGVPLGYGPRELNLEAPPDLSARITPEPHVLKRRIRTRSVPPKRPTFAEPNARPSSRRTYPRMLALLQDQTVARRPSKIAPDTPPPVPGTFFPAPREPMEQPVPTDLDQMLLTMAEGLMIGETAEGHTEIRVTLKDEFFAGTELRIVTVDGKVRAVLVPPDRDVYWQLNASLNDLKERLSGRGLEVEHIELLDP